MKWALKARKDLGEKEERFSPAGPVLLPHLPLGGPCPLALEPQSLAWGWYTVKA